MKPSPWWGVGQSPAATSQSALRSRFHEALPHSTVKPSRNKTGSAQRDGATGPLVGPQGSGCPGRARLCCRAERPAAQMVTGQAEGAAAKRARSDPGASCDAGRGSGCPGAALLRPRVGLSRLVQGEGEAARNGRPRRVAGACLRSACRLAASLCGLLGSGFPGRARLCCRSGRPAAQMVTGQAEGAAAKRARSDPGASCDAGRGSGCPGAALRRQLLRPRSAGCSGLGCPGRARLCCRSGMPAAQMVTGQAEGAAAKRARSDPGASCDAGRGSGCPARLCCGLGSACLD